MNNLSIIIITLLLSAFFSGMEIAFVSANKLRIQLDKKKGVFPWKAIDLFSNNPSQYIATMLIGNNIALVIYGIIIANILEPTIELFISSNIAILLIQTIISTLIILFLAEFLPKTLFKLNPNKTLRIFALPVYFFYFLFYPIARFTTYLSSIIIRFFLRVEITNDQATTFNKSDLHHFVNETNTGDFDDTEIEHEVKIFQNALDFSSIRLRECVVPRTEIIAVPISETIENLKQRFIETGYSKILVYEDSIDNIIGYAHSITLFKKPTLLKNIVIKLPIVPETMPANKLLSLFTKEQKSMALVVDEFGGTAGIVTMEDILEEIIGDIQDEYDKDDLINRKINDVEYIFSGRLEIDDINEIHGVNLPSSDEYETIAGLILTEHGSIPKINDIVELGNFQFKILKASTTKIEQLHLKIN